MTIKTEPRSVPSVQYFVGYLYRALNTLLLNARILTPNVRAGGPNQPPIATNMNQLFLVIFDNCAELVLCARNADELLQRLNNHWEVINGVSFIYAPLLNGTYNAAL